MAFAKVFLNPLVYWIILISLVISKRRVSDEKIQFKQKLFPIGAEFKQTGKLTIFGSVAISLIAVFFNITFIHEIILFLSIIIFILSFACGFKLLSAAYTLGSTFILFKILEVFDNRLFELGFITNHTFSSIALLIALFLFFEVAMYKNISNDNVFPEIAKSKRGRWFGMYHIQRASIIPFFVFIPGKISIASLPVLPYFTLGGEYISFAFIPFIIGFHHVITGQLPEEFAERLRKSNLLLAFLVLISALVSFYLPGIAFVSVGLALIGKLYINDMIEKADMKRDLLFIELNKELKIFAIVPNSPADILGLEVGDTITKVNDVKVNSLTELNEQLDHLIRFPNFEVKTTKHEIRTITNSKYKGNLLDLGIILPTGLKD